eukprot:6369816-Pyramimonas_sp.AAC.1
MGLIVKRLQSNGGVQLLRSLRTWPACAMGSEYRESQAGFVGVCCDVAHFASRAWMQELREFPAIHDMADEVKFTVRCAKCRPRRVPPPLTSLVRSA